MVRFRLRHASMVAVEMLSVDPLGSFHCAGAPMVLSAMTAVLSQFCVFLLPSMVNFQKIVSGELRA
eukprot:SAG31_NODE_191_length_20809_cov_64.613761_9_plen_66_part_00